MEPACSIPEPSRMTQKKNTTARKRATTARTSTKNAPAWRLSSPLKAFIAAAVSAFSVASCALNPQLREEVSLEPLLSQLGWPSQQAEAPVVAGAGQARVQTAFASCPQFFPDQQMPMVPGAPGLRELCFSAFAILHNGQTKTPVFVAERLNRGMLASAKGQQRTDKFYAEARLPQAERAELADYRGSGYSRGHMAPAGDMSSPEAMAQSFSLANMVPQNQVHNGGAWNRIEQDTRKYIERAAGDVYVFTGPVYETAVPATIGAGRVAIPTYLYKVVYDASTKRSWVHWQANSADTKAGAPISYDEFVRRTGLELLPSAN